LEVLLAGYARLIRSWAILSKSKDVLKLEEWAKEWLLWKQGPDLGSSGVDDVGSDE
jgi:hypothetical protein